jgi:hypothetical protein
VTKRWGGTGIFTGKLPFVWLGIKLVELTMVFQIMDKDFKWPVWRTSLGIDHKFENNYIATLDMSYNKISMVFTCKIGIKNF